MPVLKIKKDGIWTDIMGAEKLAIDADTLDGKHASEFAPATDVEELKILVGDTSVSDQITAALEGYTGGNTGSFTQSDYNQNDPTAADYIKNRPFYTGNLVETEVFPEQTVEIDDELYTQISDSLIFVEGKTYVVTFNGELYECVAWIDEDGAIYIGNGNIYGVEGNGNNEPFCCDSYFAGDCYLNTTEAGAYTIKISFLEPELVKLDPKYLPEGGVGYVESTSETNTFDIIQIANDFGTELTLMPESESPTGKQAYIMQLAESNLPINFIVGNEYQISINGTSYVDEALDMSDEAGFPYVVIGDIDCMMSNDYSGFRYIAAILQPSDEAYQFQIMFDAEAFGLTEAPTELTISTSVTTGVNHKIDSKFLPDHVQSDWNENNPDAEGYIANRPFYEAYVPDEELLVEQTVEIEDLYVEIPVSDALALVEGETYFVTFNDELFECVAWVGSDGLINIGNGDICSDIPGGNNEPFFINSYDDFMNPDSGWCYLATTEPGTYTIKIQSSTLAVAKKIDKKFLPDDIGSSSKSVEHIVFIDAKTGFEYMGYIYDGNWITCRKPDKVEVTTMPDKTKYKFDEQFDPTGMTITATYSDGSTSEITNYTYPEDISETFAIYCIDGAMYTDINLTVYKELQSVEVTSMPDKTLYDFGEAFDPTGMIITGICTDGTTVEITDYTYPEEVSEVFEIYCVGYDVTVSINLDIGPEMLRDFRYIVNNDGTYTLTEWKGTLNGETSNSLVIPDSPDIIL